jgi:putative ABC transport system permease protein
MLKNYLLIGWRTIWFNKTFSLLNILGLSLGMACSLIIYLWVQDEMAKDRFHRHDARLYRVMENQNYSGDISTFESTPGILAENIVKDIPEIQMASQLVWEEEPLFTVGNKLDKEKGRYVQKDFLKMMTFPLVQGDPATALDRPDGCVISKKLADKYFFGEDPMGKIIRVDNADNMVVTGILAEIPAASSLKFDFLMSYDRWVKTNTWTKEWDNNGPRCLVMLTESANLDQVNQKIKGYIKTKNANSNVEIFLQNYGESYLRGRWKSGHPDGGRIEYVRIFTIVAIIILLIACINFMNLATARSLKRAREVGVRKVVGARKGQLVGQFISEAILISSFSLLIAFGMVYLFLPAFNQVTTKSIQLPLTASSFWITTLGLVLITGLIAGSYPAFFMAAMKPIAILKGFLKFNPQGAFLRKGLVIFQFALSIFLIIGMLVIYKQISFIHHKHLGFDQENLIYIPLEGDLNKKALLFKEELLHHSAIKAVTMSGHSPVQVGSSTQGVHWPGKDSTQLTLFSNNMTGYDYVKTMDIKLLAGRDFDPSFGMDTVNYLVNEAAAKKIGYSEPVGKELTMWGDKGQIIGLMKDFHHNSLHVPIEPLIVRLHKPSWGEIWGQVVIRTQADRTQEAIAHMEKTYQKMNPAFPFKYFFTDEEIGKNYRSEQTVGSLSKYFAFLAIFISCLGLFGLATFTAEQRIKEIGIRKVLGAGVGTLVHLLSKEFLLLVLYSALVAFPFAYYFLNQWLQKYPYREGMQIWYFVAAGSIALLIALLTVSFQTVRAAMANPTKSLKVE